MRAAAISLWDGTGFYSGSWPDSELDELVAAVISSTGHKLSASDGADDLVAFTIPVALAGRVGARPSGQRVVTVQTDPMSQPERTSDTTRRVVGLTDLLMVGGFCGFAAGTLADRKPRFGRSFSRVSLRWLNASRDRPQK